MRKRIGIATCVLALAVLLPTAANAGAVHFSESWTDEPTSWYMGEFACAGKPTTVAGPALTSGVVEITETTNGGAHVRLDIEGSVDLYEASGPPWDVQLGAYVGTWTYSAHQVEQYSPRGSAALSGVAHGQIVFADGDTAMLKIGFTLILGPDGPRLFFAKAACGGE